MDKGSMVEKLRRIELFQGIKDDDERLSKLAGIVSVRTGLSHRPVGSGFRWG